MEAGREAESLKEDVKHFWNDASCGEVLYLRTLDREGYSAQARERYRLEPYIPGFACFEEARGKSLLEIGVGLGSDHQRFVEAGARVFGLDLTERAIDHTRRRLELFGLRSNLSVGDAERLEFADASFDIVYSYGVLHHSPNTPRAVAEVFRVLKPGGIARVMIYHKWSMVGMMLWLRYALVAGRPWLSLATVYSRYLESPGTKAYSRKEALEMFSAFKSVSIQTPLGHADLLDSDAGQRHSGMFLSLARILWPRWLICRIFPSAGLHMLIVARK